MIYVVKTERFGNVLVVRDSIEEARAWAKTALGAGPRCVSRYVEPGALCPSCDSRPCCCAPPLCEPCSAQSPEDPGFFDTHTCERGRRS